MYKLYIKVKQPPFDARLDGDSWMTDCSGPGWKLFRALLAQADAVLSLAELEEILFGPHPVGTVNVSQALKSLKYSLFGVLEDEKRQYVWERVLKSADGTEVLWLGQPKKGTVRLRVRKGDPAVYVDLWTGTEPHIQVPLFLTPLVGREKEIQEICGSLVSGRLVTLTGTGGVGKTRLAIAVAEAIAEDYPDGAFFTDLASLADESLVPQTVASVLGLREEAGRSLTETLLAYLRPRVLLLVLDNCEHLVQACAGLASALLQGCAHLRILATSRQSLGVDGEQEWRVPSLSVPDLDGLSSVEKDREADWMEYEAVRLFVERARLKRSEFTLTPQNAEVVAQTCHRLDGIPLAIELAAAHVRALPIEQIAKRLDDLLKHGDKTKPPRQQTLQVTMDWSYRLLPEQEQTLLRRLSVFAGGWTLEASEDVCADSQLSAGDAEIQNREVLNLLTLLIDKSLVVYEERNGQARYRLLETIRQFSEDKLEAQQHGILRARHCDYFLQLVEEAESQLMGPEQAAWFDRLEREHDNLRAAIGWCLAEGGSVEGLRRAGALWRFWYVRGYLSEGRAFLEAALGREEATGRTKVRAEILRGAGSLAWGQGDYGSARVLYKESLSIKREMGDKGGIAELLNNLGLVAWGQGDYASARVLHEESFAIFMKLGDKRGIALSLSNLGNVACDQGDYAAARAFFEESLSIDRERGDKRGIAIKLGNLGYVAMNQGDYRSAQAFQEESLSIRHELQDQAGIAISLENLGNVAFNQGDCAAARAFFEESLAIFRKVGDQRGIAVTIGRLGNLAANQGDYVAARAFFEESLSIKQEVGEKSSIPTSLEAFAGLATGQGQPRRAARLWGAAEAQRESLGSPLPPNDREEYDRNVAAVRSALSEEAFAAAWAVGRAMTLEQAVAHALEEGGA